MIKYFIFLLVLLCLTVDLIILRQITRSFPDRRWARRLYFAHFLLLDAVILLAVLFYRQALGASSPHYMQVIMWVIGLFFMSLVPKITYLVLGLPDYLASYLLRRKVRWFSWVGFAAGVVVLSTMIWGATEGINRIVVNEVTIESDRVPPAFDGFRIVQFSDFHLGNFPASSTIVQRLVDEVNRLDADLVVSSGDLVNTSARELTEKDMEIMRSIHSRCGVYSVLGNHDLGYYMRVDSLYTPAMNLQQLIAKQEAMGWKMLMNQSVTIHRGEDSIFVSGVNFPAKGPHNGVDTHLVDYDLGLAFRDVDPRTFNLFITHTPQLWEEAMAAVYPDLTLSGHVHAMQLKIAIGSRGLSPAMWMYPHWSGLYSQAGKYLYVNDGIGHVMYPMRIGTYPELTVFTLRRRVK